MKKYLAIFTLILILLTGCATSSRLNVANSATISESNFQIIRPIQREYTATYIVGFGGGIKASHLKNAISDMTKTLQPNQALAYINVVESNWIPFLFPIIITQTTTVSAMIIEYK